MADFRDVLRQLAEELPPGTAVPVTREWLLELLDTSTESPAVNGDLSAAQVAERFSRQASTVRGWCSDGVFPNAYHLNKREWKIPLADVEAFEEQQRGSPVQVDAPKRPRQRGARLGAWRDEDAA